MHSLVWHCIHGNLAMSSMQFYIWCSALIHTDCHSHLVPLSICSMADLCIWTSVRAVRFSHCNQLFCDLHLWQVCVYIYTVHMYRLLSCLLCNIHTYSMTRQNNSWSRTVPLIHYSVFVLCLLVIPVCTYTYIYMYLHACVSILVYALYVYMCPECDIIIWLAWQIRCLFSAFKYVQPVLAKTW